MIALDLHPPIISVYSRLILSAIDVQLLRWLRRTRAPVSPAQARLVGQPVRHPALDQVRAELAGFGVRTKLTFVWSGDGAGVVEDEPRVVHVHAAMIAADRAPARVLAAAERTAALDLAAVMRHEAGHALLFLDRRGAATAGFRRLFGDIATRYRVGTAADEVERRLRRGGLANPRYRKVVSLYGAAHPHERFAEAVRLALATAGDPAAIAAWVARHHLDPVVEAQIRWAADWLRRYRRE